MLRHDDWEAAARVSVAAMTAVNVDIPRPGRRVTVAAAISLTVFSAVLVAGETWAKWWPYGHKVAKIVGTHVYPGKSILDAAGPAGAAPTWAHAWNFTVAYGKSVWMALVAALFIGAGIQTLLPKRAFTRVFASTGTRGSFYGAVAALPCLMCTCCGAPVTNALRRAGASRSSALAWWLGNPLLNPVVLIFLALVLPWQMTVTRILVGAAVVVGGSALVARFAGGETPAGLPVVSDAPAEAEPPVALRYVKALLRLAVLLVPEYFIVVVALGAFRGWLLPLGHDASSWGVAAIVVAAVAGTLLVIPTGAEIPVIAGLTAAGFATGVLGAVLIALPAISLPSMVMVGRDLSWKVVAATAGVVVVGALAGAGLLSVLA